MNGLNITIQDLTPGIPGKVVKIAAFKGMIDSTNVEESKVLFDEVIAKNPTSLFLVFDFTQLEYLNSRAIGCLVECFESIQKGGGGIVIAGPVENVRDVLTVVGIDKYLTMYPSVFDAITGLQSPPPATAPAAAPAPVVTAAPTVQVAPAAAPAIIEQSATPAPIDETPPRIILE